MTDDRKARKPTSPPPTVLSGADPELAQKLGEAALMAMCKEVALPGKVAADGRPVAGMDGPSALRALITVMATLLSGHELAETEQGRMEIATDIAAHLAVAIEVLREQGVHNQITTMTVRTEQ